MIRQQHRAAEGSRRHGFPNGELTLTCVRGGMGDPASVERGEGIRVEIGGRSSCGIARAGPCVIAKHVMHGSAINAVNGQAGNRIINAIVLTDFMLKDGGIGDADA